MILTIELPEEQTAVLAATARAQGLSAEQCAQQLLEQALAAPARIPLSARIRKIWAEMPEEVRAKLPADGAAQHDHYIYGVPKRAL